VNSKASWRLRGRMREVGEVVRASSSLRAAARQLGVNVSTISRLVQAGKVPKPAGPRRREAADSVSEDQAEQGFSEWVRATYVLTPVEEARLDLAQRALDLARTGETPAVRLAAMREFRSAVTELRLPADEGEGHGISTRSGAAGVSSGGSRPGGLRALARTS